MQPMLAIRAQHEGLLYINGGFSGELGPERALFRPVNPYGALYLDYRPLTDDRRPMARRLVFSGGNVLRESVENAAGVSIVLWPSGVIEMELEADAWAPSRQVFTLDGRQFMLEGDREQRLYCEGRLLGTLPSGADIPELHRLQAAAALLGECRDGMYLMTLNREMRAMTGFLMAQRIRLESGEKAVSLLDPHDLVGHATREHWQIGENGLDLLHSEPTWTDGAPRLPQSAEETAIAAVEASLAGRFDEAERYLTPALRKQNPLEGVGESCDLCVPMKYAPPDGRSSVGLLQLDGANMARVRPLYFRALPAIDAQTPFQIDALHFA